MGPGGSPPRRLLSAVCWLEQEADWIVLLVAVFPVVMEVLRPGMMVMVGSLYHSLLRVVESSPNSHTAVIVLNATLKA